VYGKGGRRWRKRKRLGGEGRGSEKGVEKRRVR